MTQWTNDGTRHAEACLQKCLIESLKFVLFDQIGFENTNA